MIMSPKFLEPLTENRLYTLCSKELASSNWWRIEAFKGIGCKMSLV